MSFSSEVKEELIKHYSKAAHCQEAELMAILRYAQDTSESGFALRLESAGLAKKCFTTLKKNYNINVNIAERESPFFKGKRLYCIEADSRSDEAELLKLSARAQAGAGGTFLKKLCCQRAYVRGAFETAGTLSDPEKAYHFEVLCPDDAEAEGLQRLLAGFDISVRISHRQDRPSIYLKDGVAVVDALNVMEAHVSLMNYENARIVREMRGNVNRQVNCETANISKTVNAALRQIEDIILIKESGVYQTLDEGLKDIMEIRLANPQLPLGEIGELLNPPVGKSGVNHRFRKISAIAEELRQKKEKGNDK